VGTLILPGGLFDTLFYPDPQSNGDVIMRKSISLLLFILIALSLASCMEGEPNRPAELTLMTHDSFDISEAVLQEFEDANDVKIILLPAGDAGVALNQAILSKDNPLADVFFGVDNTFMSRALEADIFEPYESGELANVHDELKLDSSNRLLPVDFGDVCLNYDKEWLSSRAIEPPETLLDLTRPEYESLIVVQNPATSSPGLAFLLATIDAFGTEGSYTYLDFWRELRENQVLVTDGWEDAYFGRFSAVGDGNRPIVVSYASSPPAEVVFSDPPIDEPPTASVTGSGTCFRQVEFAGILRGTSQRDLAEAFVDFMLGESFQEDIPLHMFVFPANAGAAIPDVFVKWAPLSDEPATISPEEIERNRESWINAWTDVVLR
jgi:thiamine transport system substrate-binding protein